MIDLTQDDFFVRDDNHTNEFFTFRQINEISNFGNITAMDKLQKKNTIRDKYFEWISKNDKE